MLIAYISLALKKKSFKQILCQSDSLKTATRKNKIYNNTKQCTNKHFENNQTKLFSFKIITTSSMRDLLNIRWVFYHSMLWRPRKLGTYSFSRHSAKLFRAPYLPAILSFPNKWENTIQLQLQGCMFLPCTPRLNSKTRTRKLLTHGRKLMGCLYSATWVHVLWAQLWRKRLLRAFIVVTKTRLSHLLIRCRACPCVQMRLLRKFAVPLN